MIALIILALLALAMLYVCYSDITRYIIPNWLVLGILALYPVWVMFAPAPVEWLMGLAMAGGLLLFGFGLFTFGIIGAGDAKLLVALGLYTGWNMNGLEFILNMALLGGLLAIVIVTLRRFYKYQEKKAKILMPRAPAPYGIAIAIAFLLHLHWGKVMGMSGPLY